MPNRRLLLLAALLLPFAAAAQTTPATASPAAPVDALNRALVAVMQAGRTTSFARRAETLGPVIRRAFDLPVILQNSVGPRFAGLPAQVKAELLDVFTQFTVASYVANFDDYGGDRFEILPETRRVGNDEVVQTRLVSPGSEPIRLDYVVRQDGGTWRIIDVLMNGSISRVAVQRSDFRSLIGSGDAAPLIASLRDKIGRLASGETG